VNTDWITNKNDIDVWFYNGYFALPFEVFKENSPTLASQYLDTRIPFTLLGHTIYTIFPDLIAKVILNISILHSFIILVVYVLMKKLNDANTAFIGALLLSSNMYYLRMIGSDYLDLGVVFVLSAILLLVSKKLTEDFNQKFLFLLGFLLTCLILTHPLSIFLLPLILFLAIAELFDQKVQISKKIILKVLYSVSLGAISSLIIFQLIYSYLTDKNDFILIPTFLQIFIPTDTFQKNFDEIINKSPWNRMFFLALILSLLTLVFDKKIQRSKVQTFWIYSLPVFSTYFILLSPSSMNVFLSRDGLYISFMLIFVSLTMQATVLQNLKLKNTATFIFYLVIVIISSLKIDNFQSQKVFHSNFVNSFRTTMLIAVFLFFFYRVREKYNQKSLIFLTISTLIFFQSTIHWKFDGNKSVIAVRDYISNGYSGELPFFFFNKNSDDFQNFASIPASFSPKGWWKTNLSYPSCVGFVGGGVIKPNSLLVVIDRNRISTSNNFKLFKQCLGDVKLQSEKIFIDSLGVYFVAKLKAPGQLFNNKFEFLGFTLPTLIGSLEGTKIVANVGSKPGFLTYGPYLSLSSGRYKVIIEYSSSNINQFDITGMEGSEQIIYTSGLLKSGNSPEAIVQLEFDLNLEQEVKGFEARTMYSGAGSFEVHKVSIEKIE
jgi:hypothetical protein